MKINESDLVYVKSDCCGCKEDYSMLNLYWTRTKHKHSLVYPMDKSQNRRDLCEVELHTPPLKQKFALEFRLLGDLPYLLVNIPSCCFPLVPTFLNEGIRRKCHFRSQNVHFWI